MSLKNKRKWNIDETGRSLAYFSRTPLTVINKDLINELKKISEERGNVNARICLHQNPKDSLHSMIILEYSKNKCKRPHKHKNIDEVLGIIEGKMLVLTYKENGNLINEIILDSKDNLVYKNTKGLYHLYFPIGDYVIYSETKEGPFQHEDCIFPKWNHKNKIKVHIPSNYLECYNYSCNHPCSLRVRSK